MIWAELRSQGIVVNHKKIYRLYCAINLQKPSTASRKKHYIPSQPFNPTTAQFPGHVWAADFLHDSLTSGRLIRIFNILDIFSIRGFPPPIDHSLPGATIAHYLDTICSKFGLPKILRSDNGPEFRSRPFQNIIIKWRISQEIIPPSQPFHNGFIESYHATMRDELLQREQFDTLSEAKDKIFNWVNSYNTKRPHSALGYKTPMEIWNEFFRY